MSFPPTRLRSRSGRPDPSARRHSRAVSPGAALVWSLLNTAVARFGTLAIGVVLARLLGPEEFGSYAVAFVALMAILSFNELGVSLAIVRWRDEPAVIAPTVTTISVAMSAVLTVLAIIGAPAFAAGMGDPGAASLVQLLSLCVLVNGVVATPAALMQRLFRQDQRMVADQVNVWVGAITSVALAVLGAGAMSLVIGRLAGAGLSALLFLRYSPLPYRLGWDPEYARSLLRFGLPLAGASLVVFLVGFVDQLVVGAMLGSTLLGFYVLAANLASWPVTLFSQPLRSVAPALFSRLQHDPPQMRLGFERVLRPLAAVALPACLVVSVAAPDIIDFVYGAEWGPAAPVLRWLALFAALRIFFELAYDFLVVLGRSTSILVIQLVWVAALVPALWYGVTRHGIVGAGVALVSVSAFVSLPMYALEFRRARIGVRRLVAGVWAASLTALGCAAFAAFLGWALPGAFATVAVSGLVAGCASLVLVWLERSDLQVFRGVQER